MAQLKKLGLPTPVGIVIFTNRDSSVSLDGRKVDDVRLIPAKDLPVNASLELVSGRHWYGLTILVAVVGLIGFMLYALMTIPVNWLRRRPWWTSFVTFNGATVPKPPLYKGRKWLGWCAVFTVSLVLHFGIGDLHNWVAIGQSKELEQLATLMLDLVVIDLFAPKSERKPKLRTARIRTRTYTE